MTMRLSRSRRRLALLVAGLTALSVSAAPPASAQPGPGDPPGSAVPLAAGSGAAQEVTLITGDVVRPHPTPDGKISYDVITAGGPERRVHFTVRGDAEHVYVVPSDAEPYLRDGSLDPALFDLVALQRERVMGADPAELPVIVDHPDPVAGRLAPLATPDLPAVTAARSLSSISATAIVVDLDRAAGFWQAISSTLPTPAGSATPAGPLTRATAATASQGSVEKIWLDRAVRVDLAESVPQIGAPEVWDAGVDGTGTTVAVLDTGVDLTHPDLADRVVGTANFTPEPSVDDGHGHGTHVAGIIAGTGAASAGQRRGVAPGASLLIGKVLPASGSAPVSWVIAGMEWAAEQGADVVNLSLGTTNPSDGTDPGSQAIDRLTTQHGTLFVVAGGNNGPGAPSVGSPGAATAALTVGAVDKQDQLADFSSRGPRLGDGAIKPNLTGPGVGIGSARAAGTSLGSPLDQHYTAASGTSMATPHVAGAAALLAQAHPDWTGEQLAAALIGAAQPADGTVYQHGTGRVDAARAFRQPVTASPATVHLGSFTPDAPLDPVSRTVRYTNHGAGPITLDLSLDLRDPVNRPVPASGVRLGADRLTVPGHGTADVAVELDLASAASGPVGGVLTAASPDGQVTMRTAVGYYRGPPSHRVTVQVLTSAGEPAEEVVVDALRIDDEEFSADPLAPLRAEAETDDTGTATLVLPDGIYDLAATVDEPVTFSQPRRITYLNLVEHAVAGTDSTVVLDARDSTPLRPATREPTHGRSFVMSRSRVSSSGTLWWSLDLHVEGDTAMTDFRATPTRPAQLGQIDFSQRWQLHQANVELSVLRRGRDLTLAPIYSPYPHDTIVPLAGVDELELVYAGQGTPEELAGVDVRGKGALVRVDPLDPPERICLPVLGGCVPLPPGLDPVITAQLVGWSAALTLEQAGARATLLYIDWPDAIGLLGGLAVFIQTAIPHFGLSHTEGEQVRRALAGGRPAKLGVQIYGASPLVYQLHLRQPAIPTHRPQVRVRDLVRVDATYRYDQADLRLGEVSALELQHTHGPIDFISILSGVTSLPPVHRVELIGPVDPDVTWARMFCQYSPYCLRTEDIFVRPERTEEDWFTSPMFFGLPQPERDRQRPERRVFCAYCRDGDYLWADVTRGLLDGSQRHYALPIVVEFFEPATTVRLFRDGIEIPPEEVALGDRVGPITVFPLVPTPARYTLEQVDTPTPSNQHTIMAPRVTTRWSFRSERPPEGVELAPRGYACPFSAEHECAFPPLLMLEYGLDLDIHNRAPAARHQHGRPWRFTLRPYHTDPAAPAVARVTVWSSTDAGATWQPAKVTRGGGSQFRITVRHPTLDQTDGFVWLKVRAADVAGNTVTQVIERAYGLTEPDH